MNPWVYSLGYNSFVFVDIAIVIAAAILVFSSRAFIRAARKYNAPAPVKAEETPASVPAEEPARDDAENADTTDKKSE